MTSPHKQSHISANFERTSLLIHRLRGILTVLDCMAHNSGWLGNSRAEAEAVACLMELASECTQQVERAHSMEWVGLGGTFHGLTEIEQAEARGEAATQ